MYAFSSPHISSRILVIRTIHICPLDVNEDKHQFMLVITLIVVHVLFSPKRDFVDYKTKK